MSNSFTWIAWAVLLVYFSATMSIGFYFYWKTRTTAGFTAARLHETILLGGYHWLWPVNSS